jgi:hypothetical protein
LAPAQADVDRLARLSDRLAASRRAKEAEIEARFAQQRAEQEEARRQVWETMQAKKAAVESAMETAAPSEPAPDQPAPEPVAEPPAPVPVVPAAPPEPATAAPTRRAVGLPALLDDSAWKPAPPPGRAPSRYAGQAAAAVMAEAQARLSAQDETAAVEALDHLVTEDEMVDNVIAAVEAAGPSASVPLLRVLGDAYARRQRLDDALAAYRQALRRL